VDRHTWLHHLHPAVKVVASALLFVVFLSFNDPRYVAVATIAALVLLLVAAGIRPLLRMGSFLILLFAVSALLWALFLDDETAREMLPAWQWGPFQITRGTGLFGLAMALRILGMVLIGLVLITTTRAEEFSYGLRCVGTPPLLTTALSLSFHLLPLFINTGLLVRQAQQARGLELSRVPVWTRFMRSVTVVVPVMGYALRRADDLTRALELWGVGVRPPTFLHQRDVAPAEALVLVLVVVLVAACIYARVNGYGEILPRL